MADTLLYIDCEETAPGEFLQREVYFTPGFAAFAATNDYYGSFYRVVETPTFTCTPYEAPIGTVLDERCIAGTGADTRDTRQITTVVAKGVFEINVSLNSLACPVRNASCNLTATVGDIVPPSAPGLSDGSFVVSYFTSNPPARFVLNGVNNFTGLNTGAFTGLPEGIYTITAQDAISCEARVGPIDLRIGAGPSGYDWLLYTVQADYSTPQDPNDPPVLLGYTRAGFAYDAGLRESVYTVVQDPSGPETTYSRPITELVDSYYLPDGRFRRVFHNGAGGLSFETTDPDAPEASGLRLVNIIRTDLDVPGSGTGSILLEATNDGAGGLITYAHLTGGTSNTHGGFSDLAAGEHAFRVQDASGQSVEVTVTVQDRYGLWLQWEAEDDFGVSKRWELHRRDYVEEPVTVCAAGPEPVVRAWDGQNDPGAELPELISQRLDFQLLTPTFADYDTLAQGDDRQHRVDFYSDGQLEFRGYVPPDLLRVGIHESQATVSITASCGLKTLSDTLFENHEGRPVNDGRWPMLHTLLHCLSRTDVNLPLYVGSQLRDILHADTDEPFANTLADRSAYGADPVEPPVLSDVATGLLRPSKCSIWQARGAWWVASDLDMAILPDGPTWVGYDGAALPAALPSPENTLGLWAIRRPNETTTSRHLVYESPGATQATTGSGKLAQATVKLQLRENNLPGGELQDWNAAATAPIGWTGPAERIPGPKAGTYALRMLAGGLQTASVATLPDPDYSPLTLYISARYVGPVATSGQPATPPAVLTVTVLTDGIPDPLPVVFSLPAVGAMGKYSEQSVVLPATTTGRSVRLRMFAEAQVEGGVDLAYVRVAVLPALVEWPDSDTQTVVAAEGALRLPTVELTHADVPRLAIAPDLYAPAQAMDVLAWRHALSHLDGQATTLWRRPGVVREAPLLDTAALDRLAARSGLQRGYEGTLIGPVAGVGPLCFGARMLSVDAPGKLLLVTACELQELSGTARVSMRTIGNAPDSPLPDRARVTTTGVLRVTTDGAVRVYR